MPCVPRVDSILPRIEARSTISCSRTNPLSDKNVLRKIASSGDNQIGSTGVGREESLITFFMLCCEIDWSVKTSSLQELELGAFC